MNKDYFNKDENYFIKDWMNTQFQIIRNEYFDTKKRKVND